ncbi:MAG: hypothetical protein DRH08_00125 [Deltaproteobacteria bacterium]|nr:MAG: hypothetical protein DRH08_00125 [Deltaproteobacteria bacterium]
MPSLNRTRIDRDAERSGVWKDYAKARGIRVQVARWGNPEHTELLKELSLARQPEIQALNDAKRAAEAAGLPAPSHEDEGVLREINAEAMAKTLLKDWSGVTETDDADSPEVPYHWEAAYASFMDRELPFYDDMLELTMAEATFRKNAADTARGN